jgi:hypothetical protein
MYTVMNGSEQVSHSCSTRTITLLGVIVAPPFCTSGTAKIAILALGTKGEWEEIAYLKVINNGRAQGEHPESPLLSFSCRILLLNTSSSC